MSYPGLGDEEYEWTYGKSPEEVEVWYHEEYMPEPHALCCRKCKKQTALLDETRKALEQIAAREGEASHSPGEVARTALAKLSERQQ